MINYLASINFVTGMNFVLGAATVILSLTVAYIFYDYQKNLPVGSKKLSSSISWQLLGEATIGFGTLIFAIGAHYGWLDSMPQSTQSLIRFIMFSATSLTTLHLLKTLKKF